MINGCRAIIVWMNKRIREVKGSKVMSKNERKRGGEAADATNS